VGMAENVIAVHRVAERLF